jgi:RimJ/RimL family protein N-acetyltransferase
MSLSNDQVQLEPLFCTALSTFTSAKVHQAWGELLYRSVEAISSSLAGIEDFAEECIYLATINTRHVSPRSEESNAQSSNYQDEQYEETDELCTIIGILYLKASSLPGAFDIGVTILPEYRGNGWGPEALRLAMRWAFEELHCHRIQARIIENNARWRNVALSVFVRLGFSIEGTSRRALFCPMHPLDPYPEGTHGEWRDVTNLSILDVDWVMYSNQYDTPAFIQSMWEGLFAREERERTEILRLEEAEERRRRARRDPLTKVPMVASKPTFTLAEASYPPPQYPFNSESYAAERSTSVQFAPDLSQSIEGILQNVVVSSSSRLPRGEDQLSDFHDNDSSASSDRHTSPALSFTRGISPAGSQYHMLERDLSSSPAPSPTSPPFVFSDSEFSDDPFSDVESVPRSASVFSVASAPEILNADEWDMLEVSSVGSLAAWSASENEL